MNRIAKYFVAIGVLLIAIYLAWRVQLAVWEKELQEPELTFTDDHADQVRRISNQIKNSSGKITRKSQRNTHLFGLAKKQQNSSVELDLTGFTHVLELSDEWIHVQCNALLSGIIQFLLKRQRCLCVVPDMTHLTVGGLYSGVGGGAASFKYGQFSDSVVAIEFVDGQGRIHHVREQPELDQLANSLGSLGYILSFKIRIRPILPFVETQTETFTNFEEFQVRNLFYMGNPHLLDFLDGTIFGPRQFVLITGKLTEFRPPLSSLFITARLEQPYWTRVQQGYHGWMTTYDFIYRWDPDGYYSSMKMNPLIRHKFLRQLLMTNSLMTATKLRHILGYRDVIQEEVGDFLIPLKKAHIFFHWYDQYVGLYPVYTCPAKMRKTLLMQADEYSLDWGVGYGVTKHDTVEARMQCKHDLMCKTFDIGGDILKYFAVFKNETDFWCRYPPEVKKRYRHLKGRLDPKDRFFSISQKLT